MFKMILIPLDGSSLAEQALSTAASIAKACGAEVELLVVHTGTLGGEAEEHVYVQGLATEAARRFDVPVASHLSRGMPIAGIVERARVIGADLIVMTSHGRTGFSRAWLGSVADGVTREARIPVLVERAREGRKWRAECSMPFRRVLIPLDASAVSGTMLRPAVDLCRWLKATPILARVVPPVMIDLTDAGMPIPPPLIVDPEATRYYVNEAQDRLTAIALALEADVRMRVETEVAVGSNIGLTITEIASRRHANLIAMSTHSRGPTRLLLGSVTDKVLRASNLPLLLLHPDEAALSFDGSAGVAAANA